MTKFSTGTGTGTSTGRVGRSLVPYLGTTFITGTVQSDLNLDKSNLGARVGCNKTDPLLLDWYQYWYTEGTSFGSVFDINMSGLKKHFWPHMQAGWGRTGHTFGLFFWPHVQPKVDTLPKLR